MVGNERIKKDTRIDHLNKNYEKRYVFVLKNPKGCFDEETHQMKDCKLTYMKSEILFYRDYDYIDI